MLAYHPLVIFECFDFRQTGVLTVSETSTIMEFVVTGLSKAFGHAPPSVEEIDSFANKVCFAPNWPTAVGT